MGNARDTELQPSVTHEKGEAAVRLPYRRPSLRRLGSVRELTLGSKGGFNDTSGGMQPGPM